jgi:CubicO group peptidase (beta-lactamase class C family)
MRITTRGLILMLIGDAALLVGALTFAGLSVLVSLPALAASANQNPRAQAQRPATLIDAFMKRAAEYGQFNGVILVIDRGRRVYGRAFGEANREWQVPNTVDTRFEIASMTKPMTAIVIMQLVQEGKLRLDAKLSEHLPYYPAETGQRITVEQLLTHTSGLQQDIGFIDDPIVAAINADMLSNDSLVKLISRRPLRFEPGTGYGYSSDGYAVLGAIIEQVTGRSYWDALRERVLQRAGMSETGVSVLRPIVPRRASGYAQSWDGYDNAPHIGVTPAGGLYSTLGDIERFDRALYGDALVNEESKRLLFGLRSAITAYGWKTSEDTLRSGVTRRILRTTGGLPGFGAVMVRVPSLQRTIIMLTNVRTLTWRLEDFAASIGRILDGAPYALPKRSVAEALASDVKTPVSPDLLDRHFEQMRTDTARYALSEAELNRLGYHALNSWRDVPRAIAIFRLNVRAFPKSGNVYDSLGEAYLAHGDTVSARVNYRRSLELDPNNSNAADILRRIGPPR